ncbi:hypothetical protein PIB30_039918 [Stylosanthes scabra]|uniref:Beta-amylase n=1 Tax=Stylosanthes scabra TaxID=79078 RepID=A0ABU6QDU4_9FABA|nr:hypothetical protein [Stylosanthes scabra]
MSFHECGGNFGDDVCIPLPHWVAEIDKERVLRGRTALEMLLLRTLRYYVEEFKKEGGIIVLKRRFSDAIIWSCNEH